MTSLRVNYAQPELDLTVNFSLGKPSLEVGRLDRQVYKRASCMVGRDRGWEDTGLSRLVWPVRSLSCV